MTVDDRMRHYRARGWWPDEDLWTRYQRVVARRLDELAVADERGVEITHEGLLACADALSTRFAHWGIKPGDLVLQIMPNRAEWQVVFAALLQLGARPMTIPITTDVRTLVYLCDLTGVRSIVTSSESGSIRLAQDVMQARTHLRRACSVIVVDGLDHAEQLAAGADDAFAVDLDGVDHVMTTSSTTGFPKAVMHTNNTLAALNIGFTQRFGLSAETPLFMSSPLGHSVGAIHGARLALHLGAPLVLQERWEPIRALDLVARYGCVFTAAATPFLKDLIDAPAPGHGPKLSSVRTFLCGGAAVPPVLIDQAAEHFPNTFLTVLWGMTEGGVTTSTPESTAERVRNTAGCGLEGLELSVVDPEGAHLPGGAVGELVMRGPGVFIGYLGQADLYARSLTADGYFRTGDLARLDDDGYLVLTGRLKDLIIRGGVNISPVTIEDALAGHPAIRRVAVVGEPDERMGERLCAVVVLADSQREVNLDELVDWVRDHGLSRRLWPESIRVVAEMPVTAAGKIRKNQLRDELFGSQV